MSESANTAAGGRSIHLEGGRHGVLLFHGLSSSPLELQYIARGLHRAGHTVLVPALKGYTVGMAGAYAASAGEWVQAALRAFDQLAKECDTVSVGGLCLGAVLALRVAERRAGSVHSVLGLSTALYYDGWANPWYTRLLPLAPFLPLARRIRVRERWPFGLKDERLRRWIERQMQESALSDAGASTLRVSELIKARRLIVRTRKHLEAIIAPLLLLHAEEDECATPRSAYEVSRRVSSTDKRLILLHDSYHMISMDREKQHVLDEMVNFLRKHITGPTPGSRVPAH